VDSNTRNSFLFDFFQNLSYNIFAFGIRFANSELNAAKEKLEIVSGAAPPPFRIFAGGLPRRRRRRNAFGLIQEYCTNHAKSY
jgi:hypothetical protein